jgi:pimeloyl-ACP methyl ester carboxylesterase
LYLRSKKVVRLLAVGAAVSLLLSGCQAIGGTAPVNRLEPFVDSTISQELQPFYNQVVDWSECGLEQTYCATIQVPTKWSEPAGETLKIALAYRSADGEAIGSVIFNPGGPGASGVSFIKDSGDQLGTAKLRASYNLIGFDPRGVGQSEPRVQCLDSKETNEFLYGKSDYELGTTSDIAETRANLKKFADACLENTGPNIANIDTVSAARDLDVIRALVGQQKLNYLGFSYGTFLGATYAELFADRVGRMVLDGAINPLLSESEQNLAQLVGFDQALKNYLVDCLSTTECPFSGTPADAQKRIARFLSSLETKPIPTADGRELTIWSAITGIIMPMYSKSFWPALNQAFDEGFSGDGTTFIQLADTYNDRNEDGTFATNVLEANISISCLDGRMPTDAKSLNAQNEKVLAASPTLGRYWQFGGLTCEQWPFPVVASPKSYRAAGSNPILVVGTTGDPATPYSQAVQLAEDVLENATLITFNGEGHTAYGQGSNCVNEAVDNYLLNGTVPDADPNCS